MTMASRVLICPSCRAFEHDKCMDSEKVREIRDSHAIFDDGPVPRWGCQCICEGNSITVTSEVILTRITQADCVHSPDCTVELRRGGEYASGCELCNLGMNMTIVQMQEHREAWEAEQSPGDE